MVLRMAVAPVRLATVFGDFREAGRVAKYNSYNHNFITCNLPTLTSHQSALSESKGFLEEALASSANLSTQADIGYN